jgi:CRISPR-associated protein (TIGR03986 family)
MPARAPYNFVPLNDTVIDAFKQFEESDSQTLIDLVLPSHDRFLSDRCHGYFDVTLTTESPLYIRGERTIEQAQKEEKNNPNFFGPNGSPVIPGSSLRGMIRSLVEIVTWSKMMRVSDKPKMFFRAVAADKNDPLGEWYKNIVGQMGANVRAGFLERQGDDWFVKPASQVNGKNFEKIKDTDELRSRVTGLISLRNSQYRVQYHQVVATMQTRQVKGKTVKYLAVSSPTANQEPTGVLVCTGNMAESNVKTAAKDGVQTPRKNFVYVAKPDKNSNPIRITPQAVRDYLDGLTPFQVEQEVFDARNGCLIKDRPVFYIKPKQGDITMFGHAPFSRLPVMINNYKRAVTPKDFVYPTGKHVAQTLDLADTMFGFISQKDDNRAPQGNKQRAYAGRISVTDAKLLPGSQNVFEAEITPKILSSPKPTTFQHYLEQPHGSNTKKSDLMTYASAPGKTKVRGYKMYWRRRGITIKDVRETAEVSANDTQHTRMTALRPGVKFQFRVYFENLTKIELGALAWVLALGSEKHHPDARHMLGMAKPYGMGVVRLASKLRLEDRRKRYTSFSDQSVTDAEVHTFIEEFKKFILDNVQQQQYKDRLQEFETLLTLVDNSPARFSYMTIEPINEYKDRPVLPYPTEVVPSPDQIAKEKAEREQAARKAAEAEARRQELKKQEEGRQQKGVQEGMVVSGRVTEIDKGREVTLEVRDYPGYVAFLSWKDLNQPSIKVGESIWLFVREVLGVYKGTIGLDCRRATKEEKNAARGQ